MESNKLCPIEVWSRIFVSSYLCCIVPFVLRVNISLTVDNRMNCTVSVQLDYLVHDTDVSAMVFNSFTCEYCIMSSRKIMCYQVFL